MSYRKIGLVNKLTFIIIIYLIYLTHSNACDAVTATECYDCDPGNTFFLKTKCGYCTEGNTT